MQEGLASNTTLHGLNRRIKPVFPGSSASMYQCELQRRKKWPRKQCCVYWQLHSPHVLKYVLYPGTDQRILVWDIGSAAQVCELKGHSDSIYQLAFSRDGSILASGGLDNSVKLWNTSGFEENGRVTDAQKWYAPTQTVLSTIISYKEHFRTIKPSLPYTLSMYHTQQHQMIHWWSGNCLIAKQLTTAT